MAACSMSATARSSSSGSWALTAMRPVVRRMPWQAVRSASCRRASLYSALRWASSICPIRWRCAASEMYSVSYLRMSRAAWSVRIAEKSSVNVRRTPEESSTVRGSSDRRASVVQIHSTQWYAESLRTLDAFSVTATVRRSRLAPRSSTTSSKCVSTKGGGPRRG